MWAKRLQSEVAQVRKSEASRTRLFEERARIVSSVCFDLLRSLEPAANAALRSSNLVIRLSQSPYSPLHAWVRIDMCRLEETGEAGEVVSALELSTAEDNDLRYQPDHASLPKLTITEIGNAEMEEVLFLFIAASLRSALAQP